MTATTTSPKSGYGVANIRTVATRDEVLGALEPEPIVDLAPPRPLNMFVQGPYRVLFRL